MPRVQVNLPQTHVFHTEIPLRIDDINFGGHMGNDAVLTLAQEARTRFFNHFGFEERNVDGKGILIADAAIVYKAQAFYGDILRVDLGITDIGRKGCDITYLFTNKESGMEVIRAKTGIVFFDYNQQQVVRIPPVFLQRLGLDVLTE
ncbi:MAG: thioesterase family protein [Desulfovermiculus sp.]|nr:thioesterase family protein [Desulfovermiculus sp.]